ncbi:mitochondrial ribosomal subunit protein-domain-containing protein [Gaertneriomyces semiglobifer]|nr:mitochondrial ribosomal subunit protein-domain-containing protein [Gaertneriomyces semiglobifer]
MHPDQSEQPNRQDAKHSTMSLLRIARRLPGFCQTGPLRSFSTTTHSLARRRPNAGERRDELDFTAITGDLNKDGLHRYELDFMETAKWVKDLLVAMKQDANTLKAMHVPFKAPNTKSTPLCVQFTDRHTYDFTQPQPRNTKVTFHLRVSDLGLTDVQRHKFLLLAGKLYDPYTDVVTVRSETDEARATDDVSDRAENVETLGRMVADMVREAREGKETFEDLPVDMRHVKPRRVGLEFPKEWLRPRASTPKITEQLGDTPSAVA